MTPKELAELDVAVAKAEGYTEEQMTPSYYSPTGRLFPPNGGEYVLLANYSPTRDGAEAMRLLEKYGIDVMCKTYDKKVWTACPWETKPGGIVVRAEGPTPAIAICKAVVALKERT